MVVYLVITGIIFVLCLIFSIAAYCDDHPDRELARVVARWSFLSPLWPIGLVCAIVYGIYKFFTKIVFYKEE